MGEDSEEMTQAKANLEANRKAHKVAKLESLLVNVERCESDPKYATEKLFMCEGTPLTAFPGTPLTVREYPIKGDTMTEKDKDAYIEDLRSAIGALGGLDELRRECLPELARDLTYKGRLWEDSLFPTPPTPPTPLEQSYAVIRANQVNSSESSYVFYRNCEMYLVGQAINMVGFVCYEWGSGDRHSVPHLLGWGICDRVVFKEVN